MMTCLREGLPKKAIELRRGVKSAPLVSGRTTRWMVDLRTCVVVGDGGSTEVFAREILRLVELRR